MGREADRKEGAKEENQKKKRGHQISTLPESMNSKRPSEGEVPNRNFTEFGYQDYTRQGKSPRRRMNSTRRKGKQVQSGISK